MKRTSGTGRFRWGDGTGRRGVFGTRKSAGTQKPDGTPEAAGTRESDGTSETAGTRKPARAREPAGTRKSDGASEAAGTRETDGCGRPAGKAETTGSSWQYFREVFRLEKPNAASYSPLVLAYIGDAVFEVMIRTLTVSRGNMQVNKMHRHDSGLLKAPAQAEMIRLLEPELTEEEEAVYKRGRNAKSDTGAKNASVIDYRTATGLEALLGYLYLQERFERMTDLVAMGLERLGEKRE